ncbi:ergosterol biosynthetic protein 28-like [Hibiscus syriacus]|uniref:Ergosterol biosynthetic protein 28-like n=1 Tax=Hibiscus syriacus TaxID=106335 RepID=A0A6A2WGQ5_HIBSY|nr:ergosterol biosynthetic protein 28-like [Hibiscus syriacus]
MCSRCDFHIRVAIIENRNANLYYRIAIFKNRVAILETDLRFWGSRCDFYFALRFCWSLQSESSNSRSLLSSFGSERERLGKERKGWSITVHDLSGSPVAAASMVTPFVASPGSDRVSHSNPGSWLILRPGGGTWKPWGRLEAWRERGSSDELGYRFELIPDMSAAAIVLAESTLSSSKGGKFVIDLGAGGCSNGRATPGSRTSPACSRTGSEDFWYGLWPFCMYGGFVMWLAWKEKGSAVNLAWRLFSQRLRKELCNHRIYLADSDVSLH